MSAPEPQAGEPARDGLDPAVPGVDPGQPRYEPPPSVGKLLIWVLLFVLAAVVVVLGGVYFT
ncbi:hypothetical protein ACFV06_29815 [Streptomyces sp. NPDC059618]|uniref:hypothetical protein n=1 Tax=unclassified Streptomyces TaxID=2593676 RepID=UPI0036491C4C